MKKYRINVNGNTYEVEVEELGGASGPSIAPPPVAKAAPPAAAPKAPAAAAPSAPASEPKKTAPAAAGAGDITAPMQGKIISVEVNVGDSVSEGDVVVVLEAMKMENEVFCDADGTVKEIKCKPGDNVNSGDVLIVIG